MSVSFTPTNRSVPVTIFRVSRVINFDVYTRQGSTSSYLKTDETSPKMIEHWGAEKCKNTVERLERRRANELEVKKAAIAHDEVFRDSAHRMFIIFDSVVFRKPWYHDHMYLIRFIQLRKWFWRSKFEVRTTQRLAIYLINTQLYSLLPIGLC